MVPSNRSGSVVEKTPSCPRAIAGQTWMKNQRRGAGSAGWMECSFPPDVVRSLPRALSCRFEFAPELLRAEPETCCAASLDALEVVPLAVPSTEGKPPLGLEAWVALVRVAATSEDVEDVGAALGTLTGG